MVIPKDGKSHQVAVWYLHAIRFKIAVISDATLQINHERMKVLQGNKDSNLPSTTVL